MTEDPTSEAFFESLYQRANDPWQFGTSPYEQARYASILRALPPQRFRRAFEPGCSVGILTEKLATICDQVEAIDISPTAASRARYRCRTLANVKVVQGALPSAMPDGDFDLILLCEIGYYFQPSDLAALVSQLASRLRPAGHLLAEHWLGSSPDHLLSGDRANQIIGATADLVLEASHRHEGFRIDLFKDRSF
jgi:SAM-dependent methyltransferase